jgi:uncharacterized protein YggE
MIESPDVLTRLHAMIENGAGVLGVFDRTLVSRSRALELIDLLIESMPEEIDDARRIVRDEEAVYDKARRQAGEIIDEAVRKAERLVDADAVTVEAVKRSKELMADTEDYIASRLEELEKELERLKGEVRAGIKAVGGPRSSR